MGYIGSKSGITKLSELENDVGYTGSKGTVKEFIVSGGQFSRVTSSTVYPKFNVPVTTSQIENDSGFGKGILKDIKRNKVSNPTQESDWVSTLENASTANIIVPTKTSQLTNNAKYTKANGTITGIIANIGTFSPFGPVIRDSATFSVPVKTSQLYNDTGIKTKTDIDNLYQVHHITDRNNNGFFTFSNDYAGGANPDLYFIRFGNIRIIFSYSTVHIPLTAKVSHYVSNFLHIEQPIDYPKAPNIENEDIICGIGSGNSNQAAIDGDIHGIITIYNKGLNAYGFDHSDVNYVDLKFYAVWVV